MFGLIKGLKCLLTCLLCLHSFILYRCRLLENKYILDKKLNLDEVGILRERFNKFREELNEFIRGSNLFIENEKNKGYFKSKTIYQGKFEYSDYREHALEIESKEYFEDINNTYEGWNSLTGQI